MKPCLLLLALILAAPAARAAEIEMIKSGPIRWTDPVLAPGEAGVEKVLKAHSSVHFEELQVAFCAIAPGCAVPNSSPLKELEETVFVKEGKLTVTVQDKTAALGPGSIVLILPGDDRKYSNAGTEPVKYTALRYRTKAGANPARGKEAGGSFFVNYDELRFVPSERGGTRNYFRRPTTMCEYFEMHVTTLKPSIPSHAPHKHVNEEIIMNLQGRIEVTVADAPAILQQGDFTFVVSDEMHGIKNDDAKECSYFAFQWK